MMPVVEKERFRLRHAIIILIVVICVTAIGIAVYKQFFKDEKIGVIFGITDEEKDEEYENLKSNFLSIFDNSLNVLEKYEGNINKIRSGEDLIVEAYNKQEQTENYNLDIKIAYFNINSEIAKKFNNEIKTTFKDKSESIVSSNSKDIVYNVKYKAYEYNNILSLVVLSELKEGNSNQRIIIKTYNYNLSTNKEVTINELIEQKGISLTNANNKIKEEIKSSQEENIKLKELGYNANVREPDSTEYKLVNAEDFFVGENGYLYVVYAYGNKEITSELDVVIFR